MEPLSRFPPGNQPPGNGLDDLSSIVSAAQETAEGEALDDLSAVISSSEEDLRAAARVLPQASEASAATMAQVAGEGAEQAGFGKIMGWLFGGWRGTAASVVGTSLVVGGGIVVLTFTGATDMALRAFTSIPFSFQPDRLGQRVQDLYLDKVATQAAALVANGVQLAPLSASELAKVSSVSSNIVAEALQDKARISDLAQGASKITAFRPSDLSKDFFEPKPSASPTPSPGRPPVPPGGGPLSVVNRQGDTVVLSVPSSSAPARSPSPSSSAAPSAPPSSPPPSSPAPSSPPPSLPAARVPPPAPPTAAPTSAPTTVPTSAPTSAPTTAPTSVPTTAPTSAPTSAPGPTDTPVPAATPATNPISVTTTNAGFGLFTVSGMIAGDSFSQSSTVTNSGTGAFTYKLSTSCTAGCGALWTDATNGLQLAISRGGSTIYSGPVQVSNQSMGVVLNPGQTDTLSLVVSLPSGAGNSFSTLSTTVSLIWTATSFP